MRGDYPVYMRKEFERRGFEIPFRENDAEILQKNLVDFVSFSHYSTRVAEADSEGKYESNLWKTPIWNGSPGDASWTLWGFALP